MLVRRSTIFQRLAREVCLSKYGRLETASLVVFQRVRIFSERYDPNHIIKICKWSDSKHWPPCYLELCRQCDEDKLLAASRKLRWFVCFIVSLFYAESVKEALAEAEKCNYYYYYYYY